MYKLLYIYIKAYMFWWLFQAFIDGKPYEVDIECSRDGFTPVSKPFKVYSDEAERNHCKCFEILLNKLKMKKDKYYHGVTVVTIDFGFCLSKNVLRSYHNNHSKPIILVVKNMVTTFLL